MPEDPQPLQTLLRFIPRLPWMWLRLTPRLLRTPSLAPRRSQDRGSHRHFRGRATAAAEVTVGKTLANAAYAIATGTTAAIDTIAGKTSTARDVFVARSTAAMDAELAGPGLLPKAQKQAAKRRRQNLGRCDRSGKPQPPRTQLNSDADATPTRTAAAVDTTDATAGGTVSRIATAKGCCGRRRDQNCHCHRRRCHRSRDHGHDRVTGRTPYPRNTLWAARRSPSTILLSLESLR